MNDYPQTVSDKKLKLTKEMLNNLDIDKFNSMEVFYLNAYDKNGKLLFNPQGYSLNMVYAIIKGLQKEYKSCNS
jgi:hypothetical protein